MSTDDTRPTPDVIDRAVELVVDATDDGGQGPIATRHARAGVQALAEAGLIAGSATAEMTARGGVELIDHSGDAWVEISPDRWWCTDPNPALRDGIPWGDENRGASRAEIEDAHGPVREVLLGRLESGGGA